MKISEPCGLAVGAVGEFAGQAELPRRGLARNVLFLAAADALLGAVDHEVQKLVGLLRIAGEPMVERVLDRVLDDALRLGGGEAVLGLALELRLADEHRQHAAGAHHHVFAGDPGRALALAGALGVVLQAAQQRGAHAGLVGAAVRRRNGVAVGVEEAVGVGGPGDGPLRAAVLADLARLAAEDIGVDQRRVLERLGEIILQPFLEMERGLLRHVGAFDQFLGAGPADFDAAEQIGLGARHLEHALGLEMRLGLRKSPGRDGSAPWCRAGSAPCRRPAACPSACRARTPSCRASGRARPRPPCGRTGRWRPRRRRRASRPRCRRPWSRICRRRAACT